MGTSRDYVCTHCGYHARSVTGDFDCGMLGQVLTPVVCTKHRIVVAETGLIAWDEDVEAKKKREYPCPECGRESPLWDRETCPKCGQKTIEVDPEGVETDWD